MHRALNEFKNGTDPSIVTDFNNLSAEDKEKFKRANHSTLGPALKMAIHNLVKVTRKTEILNKAVAKGHMKDEHDLKVKYGKKPEQLKAILAKSHSFECPVRNCKLYADPDFITEWNMSQLEDTQETITFQTDDVRKEIKKQRTEPAPPVPGDEKALKKADLAKLRVLFDAIKEEVNKYEESVDRAREEELKEVMPKKFVLKMLENKSKVLDGCSELECTLDSGKSGYTFTQLRSRLGDLKKKTKESHDEVKSRIKIAEGDLKA